MAISVSAFEDKKNNFSLFQKNITWKRLTNVNGFYVSSTANERVAIDLSANGENPGFVPDGMTIDTEGNLYIATWGGSKIIKVDPK